MVIVKHKKEKHGNSNELKKIEKREKQKKVNQWEKHQLS